MANLLLSWEAVSAVVAFFAGSAFAVLAMNDFKLAKTFFLIAAVDGAGGIIMWGTKEQLPTWLTAVIIFILVGGIGTLTFLAFRYVDGKKAAQNQPPPSVPTTEAPPPSATGEGETRELLRNVEFLQHRTDKINYLLFFVRLDKPYTPQELGTFRILLTVLNPPTDTIYISSFDEYASRDDRDGSKILLFGAHHITWSADQNLKFSRMLQNTSIIGGTPSEPSLVTGATFEVNSSQSERNRIDAWSEVGGPFATLQNLDNAVITINLSASLWPKVSYIGLRANDYLLLGLPRDCLAIADPVHAGKPSTQVDWPSGQRPPEDLQWVKVVPAGYLPGGRISRAGMMSLRLGFRLQFNDYTPLRIDRSEVLTVTEAIPTCDWYAP